jgi:FkbM family methyltransferase
MATIKINDQIGFIDEKGLPIDNTKIERPEQFDIVKFLPNDSRVLELGGRYGTVSCLISKVLKDPTQHLVVEPDHTVAHSLRHNREKHDASFVILNGAITNHTIFLEEFEKTSYGNMTTDKDTGIPVKNLSLADVYKIYGIDFDALVVDCEGAFEKFLVEYPDILRNIKVIILEEDMPDRCDYTFIKNLLRTYNFYQVKHPYHVVWYNQSHLPFTVLDSSVGFGHLGLFGKLGFIENNEGHGNVKISNSDSLRDSMGKRYMISAHTDSKIRLFIKQPVIIYGYYNPVENTNQSIIFDVNGERQQEVSVGKLTHNPYIVKSGVVNLGAKKYGSKSDGHAVWIFYKYLS